MYVMCQVIEIAARSHSPQSDPACDIHSGVCMILCRTCHVRIVPKINGVLGVITDDYCSVKKEIEPMVFVFSYIMKCLGASRPSCTSFDVAWFSHRCGRLARGDEWTDHIPWLHGVVSSTAGMRVLISIS